MVDRNIDGTEKRCVVKLTSEERNALLKIAKEFGHFICGIDLIRTKNGFFIIDINGISFVKNHDYYYDALVERLFEKFIKNLIQGRNEKKNINMDNNNNKVN